jgi:hypothetical protein
MRTLASLLLVVSLSGVAFAQTSAGFKLQEQTFNNGGNPLQGSVLTAAHYKVKLDAIGGGAVGARIGSASYHLDAGFVAAYAPPGEIGGVSFSSKTTLTWSPERSVGAYEVYRNTLLALPGDFGSCFASALPSETSTDASNPSAGTGYFYLITARNRLREEGTKGFRTGGAERSNTVPCP